MGYVYNVVVGDGSTGVLVFNAISALCLNGARYGMFAYTMINRLLYLYILFILLLLYTRCGCFAFSKFACISHAAPFAVVRIVETTAIFRFALANRSNTVCALFIFSCSLQHLLLKYVYEH